MEPVGDGHRPRRVMVSGGSGVVYAVGVVEQALIKVGMLSGRFATPVRSTSASIANAAEMPAHEASCRGRRWGSRGDRLSERRPDEA